MKQLLLSFLLLIVVGSYAQAQVTATNSVVFGIGVPSCGSSTARFQKFNYNATTNTLSNLGSTSCTPSLSSTFTNSRAIISYNPKDQQVYYFKRIANGATYDTHIFRWSPSVNCPAGSLTPINVFPDAYLTIAFDQEGNGWMTRLIALATTPVTYGIKMRKVDFTTNTLGAEEDVVLPSNYKIYSQNGDYLITPQGNLFFAYDNKLATINYKDYGTSTLNATYIDTIPLPSTGQNLAGLAYADGEFISSFIKGGSSCNIYSELNMLTASKNNISYSGTFASYDNTSLTSGIGVAKKLVSVTSVAGTPGQYDVVYDVFVQNQGNYPLTNVQLIDSLSYINVSAANVVSASATLIDNPANVVLNPTLYNGTTNARVLATNQTLNNYPVSENHFTVRITARLRNITAGTVYYNSAVATATGFNSVLLRDSSANGSNPDLNLNGRPDDFGEGVKTPFVITVASETPPCSNLTTILHSQNFNTPINQATMPAGSTSQYTGSLTTPLANERFVITNNPNSHNTAYWQSMGDHGGGGRMMVVNADVNNNVIYSATVTGLCANLKYSFSAWVANISTAAQASYCNALGGFKQPRLNFRIRDAVSGLVLTNISTGDISSVNWTEYGMRFILPAGSSSVILEIINEGEGGCGNDLAIDDIQFGLCDPTPTVIMNTPATGCIGGTSVLAASLSDPSVIAGTTEYQWQVSNDGTIWTNINSATNATYTIANLATSHTNKYYRVLIAAQGNISSSTCRYTSQAFLLSAKTLSTAPTSAAASTNNTCPGEPVTLTVQGGTLGTNAQYRWYSSSCGGTLVGTGASITVNLTSSTTYFVRVEGDCNTTSCVAVAVTVNCDIDKDDDGIPDSVEGTVDTDGDSIPDYLDLDSDNDGIPDVVEAGGVDANGDGKIDNYTDADNDGFSDNVDGNLSGHLNSGVGLGALDLDGDGIPNHLDLDSDNDGIPDIVEAYGIDANNDGMIDSFKDDDIDGLSDDVDSDISNNGLNVQPTKALLRTGADTNGDGRADSYPYKNMDADSKANPYDLDSDGDGIPDVVEAGRVDSNFDALEDGALVNGWSASIKSLTTLVLPNRDGRGKPDLYDIDSDDDGIPDQIEAQATAAYITPLNVDSDGDGIDNVFDHIAGFGGNGINPVNTDGDAWPDYLDADSDNDGFLDNVEGNDFNGNNVPDDDVSLTGIDTDEDGLDDRFDADNSSAKGTSRFMGNGGAMGGPNAPGSRTTLHKTVAIDTERAWRLITIVLDTKFISIAAVQQQNKVQLSWSVAQITSGTYFIVERSVDGNHFDPINRVEAHTSNSSTSNYTVWDNTSLNASKVYYRIKAIEETGKATYSQVAIVTKNAIAVQLVKVYPNPASHYINVDITSDVATLAQVTIREMNGKQVAEFKKPVGKGHNSYYQSLNLTITSGTYLVEVVVAGKSYTNKIQVQ